MFFNELKLFQVSMQMNTTEAQGTYEMYKIINIYFDVLVSGSYRIGSIMIILGNNVLIYMSNIPSISNIFQIISKF